MKTVLYSIILPTMALLLCACSKEDLNVKSSQALTTYDVSLCGTGGANDITTKGEQINTSQEGWKPLGDYSSLVDKFYVAAWNKNGAKYTQIIGSFEEVIYSDGKWRGQTRDTWTDGQTKVFYAYANLPSEGAAVTTTSTKETLKITKVPADAKNQNDILLGYYIGTGDTDSDGTTEGIASIKFHHPLTSVVFRKGDMGGHNITFTKMDLTNVYTIGTVEWTAKETDVTTPVNSTFAWTNRGTMQTVTQSDEKGLAIRSNGPVENQIGTSFILIPQKMSDRRASVEVWGTEGEKEFHLKADMPKTDEWKSGATKVYTFGYDLLTSSVVLVEEREPVEGGTIGI